MKGIKNSLKKLSIRLSRDFHSRDSFQSTTFDAHHEEEVVVDIETKRHDYQQKIAKITTVRNYEFPEDANRSEILNSPEKVESLPVGRLEASNQYGHLRWLKSLKSPRLLASHLPFDLIPKQLHAPTAKIIYLARNPKDHIVAYYYHHRLKGIQISLDDFIDLYMAGYLLYGSYFDHVVSYWQLSKIYPNNVLFISYEELKIVPFQMARIIANFLGLQLLDEEVNEILSQKHGMTSDLGELKENDEANRKNAIKISKFQGVLGDYVNYFNAEQIDKLNDMIYNRLESQKLVLTDDASSALRRINKFGRLIEDRISEKKVKRRDAFAYCRRHEHLGKGKVQVPEEAQAEAVFIRKKDKVVIVEERYQPEIAPIERQSTWSRFLGAVFCCGRQRGYTPF
ncbi:Sulfotransferase cytosolic 1B member 1-like [Tyrophagus putrescentiae]|nr:Sulfotransferase cytosolic 1B member 1-like [Tyrophagus putrescentiae]